MVDFVPSEYLLPVLGLVVLSILVACCRYCCSAPGIKGFGNRRPSQLHSENDSSRTIRETGLILSISGQLETEDVASVYQPPAELPRYCSVLPQDDPPPDISVHRVILTLPDEPPPAYEDVIASDQ